MQARTLAIFAGLAAVAGVALASSRPSAPAIEGDIEPAGDWGPGAAFDAAAYVADSLGGVLMTHQRLSPQGVAVLAELEGFSATPYADYKGQSIGYGHLIQPGEDLRYVTPAQAQELLLSDVSWAEAAVRSAVTLDLNQPQFDALVLLAYNIGAGAFRRSTLVRMLNAGDVAGAAAQFPRWNMAGGQVLPALVARRERERSLFEGEA